MYDLEYWDYIFYSPLLTKIDLIKLHIYLGEKENMYVDDLKALLNGRYVP